MKLNLNEDKIYNLLLEEKIVLSDIDNNDKDKFISNYGDKLLIDALIHKNYKRLEELFQNKTIQELFIKEVKHITNMANINYINKIPEDSCVKYVIMEMNRQNLVAKTDFINQLLLLCFQYENEMRDFFKLRIGEMYSTFPKNEPIGLFFLRVVDSRVEDLLDKEIISIKSFNPIDLDTIAHYMYQYSFETNKILIGKLNLKIDLKDKNKLGNTPMNNLMSDLRAKNIMTLTYLFDEKIEIVDFKKDFLNYIVKCAGILRNQKVKTTIRESVISSLEILFNSNQIQLNEDLKLDIGKTLSNKVGLEIQYIWLNAKLSPKEKIKSPKI